MHLVVPVRVSGLPRRHWLPVECRIDFKVLLITFKALHGKAPKYLSDLLTFRDSRTSRSSNVPRTKRVTFGDPAFLLYAPTLCHIT